MLIRVFYAVIVAPLARPPLRPQSLRSHRVEVVALWCRRVAGLLVWGFVGIIIIQLWQGENADTKQGSMGGRRCLCESCHVCWSCPFMRRTSRFNSWGGVPLVLFQDVIQFSPALGVLSCMRGTSVRWTQGVALCVCSSANGIVTEPVLCTGTLSWDVGSTCA